MNTQPEDLDLGIIFDMDGVIIDSNPYHKLAWTNFLNRRNVKVDDAVFKDLIFGTSGGEAISFLLNCKFSKMELNDFCNEIDSEYRDIIGKSENIKLVNGLVEFLETIVRGEHKMAIATSAPTENVDLIMEKFNLQNYFDLIVDKTQIVNGKPDPEIYLKALQGLCLPKDRCIVFEDSISGILSAKSAGLMVIGLTTSHPANELIKAGAAMTIKDFSEIPIRDIFRILQN